jgi:hypothetical protein
VSRQNKQNFSDGRFFPFITLSHKYLRKFSKNFETAFMRYSGAWGKLMHGKSEKSCGTEF